LNEKELAGRSSGFGLFVVGKEHPGRVGSDFLSPRRIGISGKTPIITDPKPWCKYVAVDLSNAGGQRLFARQLQEGGLLKDELTCTGKRLFEETATAKERPGQQVVYTVDKPIKKSGGIAILRGDLALEGYMIKLPGSGNEEPHDGVW